MDVTFLREGGRLSEVVLQKDAGVKSWTRSQSICNSGTSLLEMAFTADPLAFEL